MSSIIKSPESTIQGYSKHSDSLKPGQASGTILKLESLLALIPKPVFLFFLMWYNVNKQLNLQYSTG